MLYQFQVYLVSYHVPYATDKTQLDHKTCANRCCGNGGNPMVSLVRKRCALPTQGMPRLQSKNHFCRSAVHGYAQWCHSSPHFQHLSWMVDVNGEDVHCQRCVSRHRIVP